MSTSVFGILTTFDHTVQDWKTYRSRLTQWFVANDITNSTDVSGIKRRAILLSALSEGTYRLAADLALPKDLQSVPYEDILGLLDKHFNPKRTGFGDRHNFYASTQQLGETHSQWAARLRGLTANCTFSNVEETLRDRFIMGLRPGVEKEKLYAMDMTDLTLAKAVEFAENLCSAKAAAAASVGAAAGTLVVHSDIVNKISQGSKHVKSGVPGKQKCTVCGYTNHKSSECRYSDYVCRKCNSKGHLRRMCPSTKVNYVENVAGGEDVGDDVYTT
ncbi:uncharacterized protein LOC126366577 [Pectinophora gossypiella]|uniref:uncharacterized protein LOC126366577 n=1 Tax=Pectinophora gossypiella TaxID=13191 RepID=UPI00214EF8E4|nr:uncharacterized protein LOC126366577 [Pectinophora gossypiella]